jgi:hypothetical protein
MLLVAHRPRNLLQAGHTAQFNDHASKIEQDEIDSGIGHRRNVVATIHEGALYRRDSVRGLTLLLREHVKCFLVEHQSCSIKILLQMFQRGSSWDEQYRCGLLQ